MNIPDTIITLDFETHYGTKYSLTSMTYLEYMHDERFYVQGFSYSINFSRPTWVSAADVEETLKSFDWKNVALLCQNTQFDASILAWKYGIRPAFYLDTMLMARPILYGSTSLSSLAKALFPNDRTKWKGKEIVQFKDVCELSPEQEEVMKGYCNQDIYVTNNCYKELVKYLPEQEIELIDMTLRMAYEFNLQIDTGVLHGIIHSEGDRKQDYITKYTAESLRSNEKFADLLRSIGVEPPLKISTTTGKETYAFSKSDLAFIELQHDPRSAELVEARLAVKSNILESRSQRIIDCNTHLGYLPVFLNYAGARNTYRWSGGQKLNLQNLSRGSGLRDAIVAPPGTKLVGCDLSQIENRVLAWCAGDQDALERFKNKIDPYKAFASANYGVKVEDVTKDQRQIAKAAVLGLGYGMGADKFRLFAKIQFGIELSEAEAKETVRKFRTINHKISSFWNYCEEQLVGMANHPYHNDTYKGMTYGYKHIMKPNGTFLNYHNLHYYVHDTDPKKNGFKYGDDRGGWKYVYGGKIVENIVQSLARDIIADMAIRIKQKHGLMPCHTVHDELIYVVPDAEAEGAYELIQQEMCIPPDWCSDIPLDAEGGVADNYGGIK